MNDYKISAIRLTRVFRKAITATTVRSDDHSHIGDWSPAKLEQQMKVLCRFFADRMKRAAHNKLVKNSDSHSWDQVVKAWSEGDQGDFLRIPEGLQSGNDNLSGGVEADGW